MLPFDKDNEGPEWPLGTTLIVDRGGSVVRELASGAANAPTSYSTLAGRPLAELVPALEPETWTAIWNATVQGGSHKRPGAGRKLGMSVSRAIVGDATFAAVQRLRGTASFSEALHELQHEILELVATAAPLTRIADQICRRAETLAATTVCSLLSVDADQRLHHLASPSLPASYSGAIDGIKAGPGVGSCGTAAYSGAAVEVTDIASDPLWADFKQLALPLGLKACWSSPIKDDQGRVVAVFAFYFRTTRRPTRFERSIVRACVHLCSIAIAHEATRARLFDLAYRDPETGLNNRAGFALRVAEALGAEQGKVAVHYLDIDRFLVVATSTGEHGPKQFLRSVGERLAEFAGSRAHVARFSGDEFAVLQTGISDPSEAMSAARRLAAAFAKPFDIGGQPIAVSVTSGIAIAPDHARSGDALITHAGLALRHAREASRGSFQLYDRQMSARLEQRRQLESEMRRGLANGEFELHFQPLINLHTLNVAGAEALVRWNRPGQRPLSPADFIPLAETTGLIVELGDWVLREACRTAAGWPARFKVAVNLSPVQFRRPGLSDMVARALRDSGLPPGQLELEITESVLLSDSDANLTTLEQMRELGVAIALDDFGTGYSSLSYLQRFPFDKIKIDRSFIQNLGAGTGALKILRAIVMLARSLNIRTTAEGVETREQLDIVRFEGCDEVQGYLMSRPRSAAEFARVYVATAAALAGPRPKLVRRKRSASVARP